MAIPRYKLNEYQALIITSHRKHLLVEGSDDWRLFRMMIDTIGNNGTNIDIDTAEMLISEDQKLGNREKVEAVCISAENYPNSNNLVGFVDREFREFDFSREVADRVKGHKVDGRLIWSKGHSVENYYFDFPVLYDPLQAFSVNEYFKDALDMLKNNLEKVLFDACAAGLAGKETDSISVIRDSIDWQSFTFQNSVIQLDTNLWKRVLLRKQKLTEERVSNIVSYYQNWNSKISTADFSVVRWLCHGHIGLSFVWAAYGRCIYEVCLKSGVKDPQKQAQRVLQAEESVRFNTCAKFWIHKALGNQCDYPVEVLRMLNVI